MLQTRRADATASIRMGITMAIEPDGTVSRLESRVWSVADPAGAPPNQVARITFRGDSVTAEITGGPQPVTQRFGTKAGALPSCTRRSRCSRSWFSEPEGLAAGGRGPALPDQREARRCREGDDALGDSVSVSIAGGTSISRWTATDGCRGGGFVSQPLVLDTRRRTGVAPRAVLRATSGAVPTRCLLTSAYVHGVSTRRRRADVALLGERVSRATVSRVTQALEATVAHLRGGRIEGPHPYLSRCDLRGRAGGSHRREGLRAGRVRGGARRETAAVGDHAGPGRIGGELDGAAGTAAPARLSGVELVIADAHRGWRLRFAGCCRRSSSSGAPCISNATSWPRFRIGFGPGGPGNQRAVPGADSRRREDRPDPVRQSLGEDPSEAGEVPARGLRGDDVLRVPAGPLAPGFARPTVSSGCMARSSDGRGPWGRFPDRSECPRLITAVAGQSNGTLGRAPVPGCGAPGAPGALSGGLTMVARGFFNFYTRFGT